jgi:ATP dependent DNA ligase domain
LSAQAGQAAPAGKDWIHEIKHDGFRIMACRDGDKVRLLSRKGYDLTDRSSTLRPRSQHCRFGRVLSTLKPSPATSAASPTSI